MKWVLTILAASLLTGCGGMEIPDELIDKEAAKVVTVTWLLDKPDMDAETAVLLFPWLRVLQMEPVRVEFEVDGKVWALEERLFPTYPRPDDWGGGGVGVLD